MVQSSAKETLELMLGHLGFVFSIEEQTRGDRPVLNVLTRDPGRLIGRDGHTLEELQYLLNRVMHGSEDMPTRVVVDVENYRLKEEHDFMAHVRAAAERVRRTGEPEKLAPMNSFDRRAVHQAFADDPDIRTVSETTDARMKQITLEPRK